LPALTVFQTPPDPVPTTATAKLSSSASTDEMRPLRLALPMLRHFRSLRRPSSICAGVGAGAAGAGDAVAVRPLLTKAISRTAAKPACESSLSVRDIDFLLVGM